MEKMQVEMDLKTIESLRNLRDLIGALDTTNEKLKETGKAADGVDKGFDGLSEGAKKVKKGFEDTEKETSKLRDSLRDTGKKAQVAGAEMEEGGNRGKRALSAAGESAHGLSRAFEHLGGELKATLLGFLSLHGAIEIMRHLEEQTLKVVEARSKLAEFQIGQKERIRPLMSNLGLLENEAGEKTALALANRYREQTGASLPQAVELLAQAQANQFGVFTADKSKTSGTVNEAAFQTAAMVGQFAARTGIDAESAGKLFNLANISGAKTPEQMAKMLQMLETGGTNAPVTNPAQFIPSAIRALASQMAQRGPGGGPAVDFAHAMANFAAATVVEPEPTVAATNVTMFSEVASGMGNLQSAELGRMALARGLITREQVEAGGGRKRKELMAAHGGTIARLEREIGEAEERLPEENRREEEDIALDEKRIARMPAAQRAKAKVELERKKADLSKNKRDRQERIDDMKATLQQQRAVINKQVEDEGLEFAYKRNLSLQQKQEMLMSFGAGATPEEMAETMARIAPGQIGMQAGKLMSESAQATRSAVIKAAGEATGEGALERNREFFASGTLAGVEQAKAALDAVKTEAVGPGAELAEANISAQADDMLAVMRTKGQGFASYREEGKKGEVMLMLLRENVVALWNQMAPEDRKKYPELYQLVQQIRGIRPGDYYFNSTFVRDVQDFSRRFFALRSRIRQDFVNAGREAPGKVLNSQRLHALRRPGVADDAGPKVYHEGELFLAEPPATDAAHLFEDTIEFREEAEQNYEMEGDRVKGRKGRNWNPVQNDPAKRAPAPSQSSSAGGSVSTIVHIGNYFASPDNPDLPGRWEA